jgi:hypothetical protein
MTTLTLGALTTSARANPVLDFTTGLADQSGQVLLFSATNFAPIDGYLPAAGIGSAGSLFTFTSGTFWESSPNSDPITNDTVNGLGSALGWATDTSLASLLGLSTDLQYTFLGWSTTTDPLADGTSGAPLSNDIRNTAVPEPGSIFLLGSGLLYAASSVRRRLNL